MNELQALFDSLKDQAAFSAAPVERWRPERCGEVDIRIDANAHWFHEGERIAREQLVKLFASVLLFEEGQYYLVTPVEKMRITVDDVPFLVEESEWQGDALVLKSNVGEVFTLDAEHPLEMRDGVPYVLVRNGLWARVVRSLFYDWVNNNVEEEGGQLVLKSAGSAFSLGAFD
jgi:hypothetical protein